MRQRKEVVDATPSFKTQWGYETMASSRVYAKQGLESAEQRLPKMLSELRQEVEEYTDAELPMLAMGVRGRKTAAERKRSAKKTVAAKPVKSEKAATRPAPPEKAAPPPPPPAPTKTPEEIRAELLKGIEEVDGIHEKVISTIQAVQEAQTDQWQKRYAGDAVTMARMARKQDVGRLRQRLERARSPLGDGGKDHRVAEAAG